MIVAGLPSYLACSTSTTVLLPAIPSRQLASPDSVAAPPPAALLLAALAWLVGTAAGADCAPPASRSLAASTAAAACSPSLAEVKFAPEVTVRTVLLDDGSP